MRKYRESVPPSAACHFFDPTLNLNELAEMSNDTSLCGQVDSDDHQTVDDNTDVELVHPNLCVAVVACADDRRHYMMVGRDGRSRTGNDDRVAKKGGSQNLKDRNRWQLHRY